MSYHQTMADIYRRLADNGLDRKFVTRTALPQGWQDSFAKNPEQRRTAEHHLTTAFGLDPAAFAQENSKLVWPGEDAPVQWSSPPRRQPHEGAMLKLGRRLAALVHRCNVSPLENWIASTSVEDVRSIVIEQHRALTLQTLTTTCWSLGLPVLYLGAPPGKRSYVDGMLLGPSESPVIILSSHTDAPGWALWQLAYLIGHLNRGGLEAGDVVISDLLVGEASSARLEADQRACTLIHGHDSDRLEAHDRVTGVKLAQSASDYSRQLQTDVGAIVVGFAVKKALKGVNARGPANKALKVLGIQKGACSAVGRVASPRLNLSRLTSAEQHFMTTVMQGLK